MRRWFVFRTIKNRGSCEATSLIAIYSVSLILLAYYSQL